MKGFVFLNLLYPLVKMFVFLQGEFFLCSWQGSNLGSSDLESDVLPIEPPHHPKSNERIQTPNESWTFLCFIYLFYTFLAHKHSHGKRGEQYQTRTNIPLSVYYL